MFGLEEVVALMYGIGIRSDFIILIMIQNLKSFFLTGTCVIVFSLPTALGENFTSAELINKAQNTATGSAWAQTDCTQWMFKFLGSLGLGGADVREEVLMTKLGSEWIVVPHPTDPTKPGIITASTAQQNAIRAGTGGTKGVVRALTSRDSGTEVANAKVITNLKPGDIVQYWSLTNKVIGSETYVLPEGHTAVVLAVGAVKVTLYGSHRSVNGVGKLDLTLAAVNSKAAFWAVRPVISKP